MKSILIIVACVTALFFGPLRANELNDMLHSRDYTCWSCDAKIKHVCQGCHGHWTIQRFGKSNQDGHYARVCSGCAHEANSCCQPKTKSP
jgi:hypothetical protein